MQIEREIVFPASPDEVWEALTEPERLEEWFATEVELDAQPGGAGVFRWENGEERRAVVREATPGERLVLDWDDEGEVVLELEEVEGGTQRARRRDGTRLEHGARAACARVDSGRVNLRLRRARRPGPALARRGGRVDAAARRRPSSPPSCR